MPLRPRFWDTLPLADLTPEEWEALCDGCGKCCLQKLEYEDNGEVAFTRVACHLLDGQTCRCKQYETRHSIVPDCVTLTPEKLADVVYWLPRSCAYRLRHEGRKLPRWHYLRSGDPESVHRAKASVQGWTISEADVSEDDWDEYIIAEKP